MPVWAITLLIAILQKVGLVNWAEALTVKVAKKVVDEVKDLKTYSDPKDFPHGRNGV